MSYTPYNRELLSGYLSEAELNTLDSGANIPGLTLGTLASNSYDKVGKKVFEHVSSVVFSALLDSITEENPLDLHSDNTTHAFGDIMEFTPINEYWQIALQGAVENSATNHTSYSIKDSSKVTDLWIRYWPTVWEDEGSTGGLESQPQGPTFTRKNAMWIPVEPEIDIQETTHSIALLGKLAEIELPVRI